MGRDDDDRETPTVGRPPPAGRLDAATAPARPERPADANPAAEPAADSAADPTATRAATPGARRSRPPETTRSVFDVPRPRFDEQGELGRGGMGRVVEALDRSLGRRVAIKHSLATASTDLARFEREVRITARLQHPGIVPILDVGRDDDGHPYYVMRKVEGEPLADRVTRATTTVRDRLALVPSVLGAVDAAAYAHAQGIVHRDIKPWNILLGPFGETLLIDWGLARELGAADEAAPAAAAPDGADGLTRAGFAYGTPGFMAPEQARGEAADPRADVYALGATLYFVLGGRSPFGDSGATEAIERAGAGEMPDLAALPDDVPTELVAILAKALAADRAARYADAGELATDLRRFLAGQLVAAHRYTLPQLVARWIRRHRVVAAVSSVALIVTVVVGAWSVRRVVAERDQARAARALAERRAEEILVDRARLLATVDPTSAVALLRQLPPGSALWPAARQIVRAAVTGGVERALTGPAASIQALAFARDGRLASSAVDGVRVHDVRTGAHQQVTADVLAGKLAWLDDRSLAISFTSRTVDRRTQNAPGVGVLDVTSGALRVVRAGETDELFVLRGRAYARLMTGEVLEIEPSGEHRIYAEQIEAIGTARDRLVMTDRSRLIVLEPDGQRREHPISVTTRVFQIEISPSGRRVGALLYGAVQEWELDAEARPLAPLPRSKEALNGIAYVGETLYAYSTEDGAFRAARAPQARATWMATGEPLPIATFDGGGLFATRTGELAYADARLGAIPLPHRAENVDTIAIAPDGRHAALGTSTGPILLLDLDHVRPALIPLAASEHVADVDATHLLIADAPGASLASAAPQTLRLVELATGGRVTLGEVSPHAMGLLAADKVVASGGVRAELVIWQRDGRELVREPDVRTVSIASERADAPLHYGRDDGALVVRALGGDAAPRTLATLPATARPGVPPFFHIAASDDGSVSLVTYASDGRPQLQLVDARGVHPLELGLTGDFGPRVRTRDGAWWTVLDHDQLYRVPAGGPPQRVRGEARFSSLSLHGDEVWARTSAALYRFALDGSLRAVATLAGGRIGDVFEGGFATGTPAGVVLVMPDVDVRRLLRLPLAPSGVVTHPAATTVAAELELPDGTRAAALWRDPVPLDPAAVPAYVDHLTNARVLLGSDAVLWDR